MTFIPANSNKDFWAVLGAVLATLAALFGWSAWARRAAERRAAERRAAAAAEAKAENALESSAGGLDASGPFDSDSPA